MTSRLLRTVELKLAAATGKANAATCEQIRLTKRIATLQEELAQAKYALEGIVGKEGRQGTLGPAHARMHWFTKLKALLKLPEPPWVGGAVPPLCGTRVKHVPREDAIVASDVEVVWITDAMLEGPVGGAFTSYYCRLTGVYKGGDTLGHNLVLDIPVLLDRWKARHDVAKE